MFSKNLIRGLEILWWHTRKGKKLFKHDAIIYGGLVIPISTSTCEIRFSEQNFIKNDRKIPII
jgi:hypothetical protein